MANEYFSSPELAQGFKGGGTVPQTEGVFSSDAYRGQQMAQRLAEQLVAQGKYPDIESALQAMGAEKPWDFHGGPESIKKFNPATGEYYDTGTFPTSPGPLTRGWNNISDWLSNMFTPTGPHEGVAPEVFRQTIPDKWKGGPDPSTQGQVPPPLHGPNSYEEGLFSPGNPTPQQFYRAMPEKWKPSWNGVSQGLNR